MSKSEGGRRLGLVLGATGGLLCALLMALLLLVYGAPYNDLWWWVMLAILIAAFVVPRLLVGPLEWVFDGYRQDS
jgi:predicted lysophospholipase L1 biosynthesis ABC-type transport system permease subunit